MISKCVLGCHFLKKCLDLAPQSKHVSLADTPASKVNESEKANPFYAKFVNSSLDAAAKEVGAQTLDDNNSYVRTPNSGASRAHTDHQRAGSRVQHMASRSSSRRPDSSRSLQDRYLQTLHFEYNPQCNGGLKNAVDSVNDKLKEKLWVGTLGTHTDSMGDDSRNYIDLKMYEQDSLPIWIPDAEFESCYDEFCHQVRHMTHLFFRPSDSQRLMMM
jgi:trehalose-6-phosphate synthase